MSTDPTCSEWVAVRSLDGRRFVLKVVPAEDVPQAKALAADQPAELAQVDSEHLVRQHGTIEMADGVLVLVLDEVGGGSLAQLLGARGQLTAGETVTTVAPLFRALADLHAAGVVHGDLVPGNVLFSQDGRPMVGDLGVARLLGRQPGPFDAARTGTGGFVAPELLDGAEPSPESDVYAMAALGWFCVTGAAPAPAAPAAQRALLATLRPKTPPRLVEVLIACLAVDPAARPTAGTAAVQVFDATPAESVALAALSDPAAEITRRIRAGAASVSDPTPLRTGKRHPPVFGIPLSFGAPMVVVVVAVLVAVTFGVGATWFLRQPTAAPEPVAVGSTTHATRPLAAPPAAPVFTAPATTSRTAATAVAPRGASRSSTEVVTTSSSPRTTAAALLQALVDARALAYVARSSGLLDLVYAPGATPMGADNANIAGALRHGGTYLGLSFVVKDAAFLDGTSGTARIRATILTPAYRTGQPDGRKIPHAKEVLGPCIFSLSLTPDGWRISALTAA